MFVRNRRVVVFGAQRPFGHKLVEALLALGAHVLAAGPLRTELETLRAELRQHHHLNVAECSPDELGATLLLQGALRRGHADVVVFVADASDQALLEADATARAVASVSASGIAPLDAVLALPAPVPWPRHGARLTQADQVREFRDLLRYDPNNLDSALATMLTRLSPTTAT